MTEQRLALFSPAKVNLFLEVTAKRSDGYHDLESVFHELDFADRLEAEAVDDGEIRLECDMPGIPLDESNTIVRAAALLRRSAGVRQGIHFKLCKSIPAESGLGGGSSNAAAALRLAERLWRTGTPADKLAELAAGVGSDVPFFLHGGACLCRGRGEIITPLPSLSSGIRITLVLSNIRSGTAMAYKNLRLPLPGKAESADDFIAAMATGDEQKMAARAFNRFEETVFAAIPGLGELFRRLSAVPGVLPRLSGSGASLWYFGSADAARQAIRRDKAFSLFAESIALRFLETRPAARSTPRGD